MKIEYLGCFHKEGMPPAIAVMGYYQFNLKIDGVLTYGIANFDKGFIVIHSRHCGSKVFDMDDYDVFEGDLAKFTECNLESAPMLNDCIFDKQGNLIMEDIFNENS